MGGRGGGTHFAFFPLALVSLSVKVKDFPPSGLINSHANRTQRERPSERLDKA